MEKYIFIITLCVIGIVLLILGGCFIAEGNSFELNKTVGKAVVVGYDNSNGTRWSPLVKICGIESKVSYNCKMKNFVPSDYPKGTIIDVEYQKKIFLGSEFYDIRAYDPNHKMADSRIIGRVILIISFLMLIFALLLFIIKIKSR